MRITIEGPNDQLVNFEQFPNDVTICNICPLLISHPSLFTLTYHTYKIIVVRPTVHLSVCPFVHYERSMEMV